jgi:hypothetical protein
MPRSPHSVPILATFALLALTAACHREQAPVQGQRIALDQVPSESEQPLSSPDTEGARWMPSADGQAIDFGRPGQRPFLSLACNVRADPPQVTVIRHAPARPGEKALFPVMSYDTIARFKVDAALRDNEWRWEGTLPADDPQLEVFEESRALEATLPGGGTLKIAGSGVPGEFLGWCRERGRKTGIEEDKHDEAAKPAG